MKYLAAIGFVFFIHVGIQAQQFNYLPSASGEVVNHHHYTLSYAEKHEQAEWVAYELTRKEVYGSYQRTDNFREDIKITTGSAGLNDYKGSGYDRGHLAPAADMKFSSNAMSGSFFLSNMSPQDPSFNRGIWKKLEEQIRSWAIKDNQIYVVTGPVFKDNLGSIGKNHVTVPGYYYKVILDYQEPEIKAIALVLPNRKGGNQLKEYVITIDSLESLTGIDFYPALSDQLEEKLESEINLSGWSFETISIIAKNSHSSTIQCKGIAKSTGKRCQKKTSDQSGYCHYHRDQDIESD